MVSVVVAASVLSEFADSDPAEVETEADPIINRTRALRRMVFNALVLLIIGSEH